MAKPRLTFAGQLGAIPLPNRRLHIDEHHDGQARVIVETELRYRGLARLAQRMLRLRTSRRYELTGIGLEVFRDIDGHKTFEQLIDQFAARHQLTFFEARALLLQYIGMLAARGIVVVGVRQETSAKAVADSANPNLASGPGRGRGNSA